MIQRIEVTRVLYLILLCFGTLFGLGAFFLLAGLLRLPTSASTKAVLTVTSRGKSQKGSINAVLFDMAARLSPLVHLDNYKRKKLEAQLKSAEIKMSPETYIAAAWVKAGLIALLIIPALLIFPILAPVIVFLAVAVYFKEQKRADEIVQQRREEIEAELPRFVNTIEQELRASRDVLNILKSYQRNAGHAMKRELEITIADMASGNEENALTRMESRIGSTMLSDVVRGLISVKRGDNGIMYFQMLSMTFKQLELQKLKLEAMKQPGKMRKYSFMLLGCFLLMYLGVLGYGTYWRLLERLTSGTTARFQFAKNIYSTYNQRVHFSPVWFPDGSYTVNTHVMDIWTPAGMLAMNLTDDVTISGSLYDDWHIAPGNP